MKILVIPSWYPNPKVKTQGLFFRDQALALSKKHDVDIIYCHRGSCFYKNIYQDEGLKTYFWGYKLRAGKYIGMIMRIFIFVVMYFLYQRKNKIEIIHCHSVAFNQDGSAGVAGVILGKLFSIPVVITEHATVFNSGNYGFFEKKIMKWALRNASSLVSVSDGLNETLKNFSGRLDIITIPNTLNISSFRYVDEKSEPISHEGKVINICSVGYLMHKKGFDRLIFVVEQLKFKYNIPIKVNIIGDGPDYNSLLTLIKNKNLNGTITLLGELCKEDIADYMRQSDFFVLLSRVETFGVVIIEALASGLYCVATECGGPEYILTSPRLGKILINTDEVSYLSKQVADVIKFGVYKEHKDMRTEYADKNFSYESFLNSFNRLILSKYELS